MELWTNQINIKDKLYNPSRHKYQKYPVSDEIYTLDIEVSNLFKINGVWQSFDYSINDYRMIEKAGVPYIWMFGAGESDIYYGREWSDFGRLLLSLSDENITKIIYVHNLSYEFAFLLDIINKYEWTVEEMVARTIKKPIQFKIKELNIIFRCSYMLTNLSLDNASKEYTDVAKRVGDLDYQEVRSPLTKLSEKELSYCEYDIICLREIIRHFRHEYKHIFKIPLTSTGIVRKALREALDVYYIRKQQKLVPSAKMYLILMSVFAGGFTHGNFLYYKRVLERDMESQDEASAYPCILCTEQFPVKPFIKCLPNRVNINDNRAYILKVHFKSVKSLYYNHYIQLSKMIFDSDLKTVIKRGDLVQDNGRCSEAYNFTMWITEVDLKIIIKNYKCDYDIEEAYFSKKDYLDIRIIRFILDKYKSKTELKGIPEFEAIYKRDKAMLNSCFGMAVTNPLKQSSTFSDGFWSHKVMTVDFINEKLEDMKKSWSTLFYYAVGCYVTAYARRNLFDIILSSGEMDRDTVYCDTDSIKFLHPTEHQEIFMDYNRTMLDKYKAVCEKYTDLTISDFMPYDSKGIMRPIGMFEFDGRYKEFIQKGAKKYCYRDYETDKLKITVAGVAKSGVDALNNDIYNFKDGFIWDYKNSGKMAVYYHELINSDRGVIDNLQSDFEFIDKDGNTYKSTTKWSVVLFPTTYTLGRTDIAEALININEWRCAGK